MPRVFKLKLSLILADHNGKNQARSSYL